ncbi:type I polyketide synthase [Kutzneria sp. CA-103260]|uniref:type I polyketide synthase n=1 Tax=Kutzneria sp. CA-103260 TaxID=2802641 RepID=UPI001BA898A1|nr:type I polyketide synthase [Kutzneria sp. CA-103260]QUQ68742.1 8-amino-7-oxononanoate synthase [Kutzneria sp. CA-103260]
MSDIAVVGLACRFPGAADVGQYWRVILQAERQFDTIPPDRWRHETFYDPHDRRSPHAAYTDQVAFLDDVERFATLHYNIPPRRAIAMDPQHRLFIDLARESLQDAGWERRPFDREHTGVFVGLNQSDYQDLASTRLRAMLLADGSLHRGQDDEALLAAVQDAAQGALAPIQAYSLPGTMPNMAACAVSSVFDLGGPAFAVDSACSSAMVALHEAVHHLRAGTCTVALVGGVFLNLTPDALVSLCRVGAVSANGVCRPFDERADGFVLGEGGAVVVLRPLADAVRDGDRVYAVIKGVGTSNDGASEGPVTPRVEGQLTAFRAAYRDAGVSANTIEFFEAHGTGTVVGDRVELKALGALRAEESDHGAAECRVSSVKALIGHTMAAAGIAGLVKTVLALHNATIPPQPETIPDAALLDGARLTIAERALPWRSRPQHPRRAGVSAFGFGGTNVHVVLEEAPARSAVRADRPVPFLLTADSLELLAEHVTAVREQIVADPGLTPSSVAYTLATRAPLPARVAFVATGRSELIDLLGAAAAALRAGEAGDLGRGIHAAAAPLAEQERQVAFLYPGQGVQRVGMLSDLYHGFRSFRGEIERLDDRVHASTGTSFASLLWGWESAPELAETALTDTRRCQPALGALGIATTALLAEFGVRPDITMGHSVGEFPAAVAAGLLDPVDAIDFLVHRGEAIANGGSRGAGGMVAVQSTEERFDELTAGIEGMWPGCFNHPEQVVGSGSAGAVAMLTERCAEAGVTAVPLRVSHAFHSPLVADADELVAERIAELPLRSGRVLVSTVSGRRCTDLDELRGWWQRSVSSPVRFAAASQAVADSGARVFVQVFGGNGLLAMARRSIADATGCHFVALESEPDDGRVFLSGLVRLAVLGLPVDLLPLFGDGERDLATLPSSPLAAQPYSIRTASRHRPPRGRVRPVASPGDVRPTIVDPPEDYPVNDLVNLLNEVLTVLRTLTKVEHTNALAPARDAPPIRDQVLAAIAEISVYPPEHLRGEQSLGRDLGFDSIMIADLGTVIRKLWPELPMDGKQLSAEVTVDDLVRLVDAQRDRREPELPQVIDVPAVRTEPVEEAPEPPLENIDPAAFPEIVESAQRVQLVDRLGLRNPYFVTHEGINASRTRVGGTDLICFSSYNYVGLSGHPAVTAAAKDALDRYGTSVSAARMLSGDRPLHAELDGAIADLLGTEAALTLVSGHATNVTVIGHLLGPDDLVVHDALAHDSVLQGCRLSGATRRPFPHGDLAALDELLGRARRKFRRVLIVVEGIYSMDGDIADLPELLRIKKRHGAMLMVDEAHSIGVLGTSGGGIGEHFGVDRAGVDIWMGTLSKAFASCGGYVAGSRALIDYFRYTLPGFVYSVGMTPANAAAALAAMRQLRAEPDRLTVLRQRSKLFAMLASDAGINIGASRDTPVVPCIVGSSMRSFVLANALYDRGVSVCPIVHPAVEEQQARLRFFVTAEHTSEEIAYTVGVLADELARLG